MVKWLKKYDNGGPINGPKVPPIKLNGTEVYEHGEDSATADKLENGVNPTDLTQKGIKYAKQIGKQAAQQGKKAVISSDIQRAKETADLMANEAGMQHTTSPLLRTWDIGEYDGAPEGSFKEKQWIKNPNTVVPGGEPFSNFAQRMEQAYDMVKKAPANDDIITHSKVTRAFKALESTGGQWTDKTTKKFSDLKDEPKKENGGWLNKYEQGGLVLKQQPHDNYGKQSNYNDAKASTGPGFVGLGYGASNWKSPAWGGQFQNGGSLHNKAWVDSVNNANMDKDFVQRYYAKNNPPAPIHLSQTPSGEMSTHYMADADNMVFPTVVNPKTFNPLDVYTQPGNLQYLDKPGPVVDRKTAGDYARRTGEYIDFKNEQDAQWYANNGYKKGTGVLNSIDKGKAYNNPKYQMGGSMPGAVGFTYARTAGSAPANGKYTKKTKASAADGIDLPKATLTTDNSQLSTAIKSGTQKPTTDNLEKKSFDESYSTARKEGKTKFSYRGKEYSTKYKGTPEEQLTETGITDAQLQKRNIIQDNLAKNLTPFGYDDFGAIGALFKKSKDRKEMEDAATANKDLNSILTAEELQRRLDAVNLYSGYPQKYGTFSVSKYKPTVSKNKDDIYYSITNKHLLDNLRDALEYDQSWNDKTNNYEYSNARFNNDVLKTKRLPKGTTKFVSYDDSGVMGNYTTSLGKDDKGEYISYYDKWDLDPIDFGKPMEIYDRVYLKDLLGGYKDKPKMQNGGEMAFYQNGLDWKPKNISKNGSVIEDDMGQWAHPGEITRINSNNITMEGVDYPVLGVSDTGHQQMMYPDQHYKFDGKKVTEYPMAQDGWLSKSIDAVGNVMSAPARGLTYLATGKYQDPSEALGITNSYAKFATDAILDPINLVGGVGLLNDARKIGKEAKLIDEASKVKKATEPLATSRFRSMEEVREYNKNLVKPGADFKTGATKAPPKGMEPRYYEDKKNGGWLDKYK